jgi:hypothetical protein
MEDIATALGQLDEPTRLRVLNWIEERFRVGAPSVAPPAPLRAVAGLPPRPEPDQGADETLAVSNLDDFFDAREPKALNTPATPAQGQSVTGMLHDFVVEFQGIAREWNAGGGPTDGDPVKPVLPIVS